jgi:hypothetical protein
LRPAAAVSATSVPGGRIAIERQGLEVTYGRGKLPHPRRPALIISGERDALVKLGEGDRRQLRNLGKTFGRDLA